MRSSFFAILLIPLLVGVVSCLTSEPLLQPTMNTTITILDTELTSRNRSVGIIIVFFLPTNIILLEIGLVVSILKPSDNTVKVQVVLMKNIIVQSILKSRESGSQSTPFSIGKLSTKITSIRKPF